MTEFVSLYDAKTRLSSLVDQAAKGDEFVISKNGVPLAKLGPIAQRGVMRVPAHTMGVGLIPADFDAADAEIQALFEG